VGVFVSSHILSEMELMCDRIYIIDNGEIIGEKNINQTEDSEDAPIYQYVFVTDNNEMTYEYMKSLDINCELKNDGVEIVMKSSEIPNIVKTLVNNNIGIYAVNQKRRSLEQDFISITTGSKTQIR